MTSKILEQYTDQELDEIFCRDVADIPTYYLPPPSFCKHTVIHYIDRCERYEICKIGKSYTIRVYENNNVYQYSHENKGRAIVIALLKKEYNIA